MHIKLGELALENPHHRPALLCGTPDQTREAIKFFRQIWPNTEVDWDNCSVTFKKNGAEVRFIATLPEIMPTDHDMQTQ